VPEPVSSTVTPAALPICHGQVSTGLNCTAGVR
jgi:hypothetical protein